MSAGTPAWVVSMNGEPYAVFTAKDKADELSAKIEGDIKELSLNNPDLHSTGVLEHEHVEQAKGSKKRVTPADDDVETKHAVAPSKQKSKASNSKASKSKKPDPDASEQDEEALRPKKKAKASKPKGSKSAAEAMPSGKPGALNGALIGMTGTACCTRDTLKAAVMAYGGSYIEDCAKAEYVVVGKRAGDKKLNALKSAGVATITDEQLLAFFNGETPGVEE